MLAVWSTRVGLTRISVRLNGINGRRGYELARGEGVSRVAGVARANRVVIPNVALCIHATRARTGVATLFLHAGQVVGALSVDEALRPTTHVGVSNVFRDTLAGSGSVALGALGISAAR